MKRLALIGLWLLANGSAYALAQERSVSYSTWIVSGNMVTLRFLLPVSEAKRLVGGDVAVLTTSRLGDYLLQHQTVQSAGGECAAIDQGFDLGRVDPLAVGPDLYGFEIFYRCQDPRGLVLHNTALFSRIPQHVDFASIQVRGRSVEQLFTAGHQELALPDDRTVSAAAFFTYVRLGLLHVLTSANLWLFLLGALLLVRRRLDVGYLILALAMGYLLSLLVAATGWLLPRQPRVEAFLGILVALLAALIAQGETRGTRGAQWHWPAVLLLAVLLVALVRAPAAAYALLGGAALSVGLLGLSRWFGDRQLVWPWLIGMSTFLDGFALPAVLGPAQWPQRSQLRMLMGFDLGAVVVAVLLLGTVIGVWRLLRAVPLVIPRPLVNDVCSASLYGLGTFWLLTRLA